MAKRFSIEIKEKTKQELKKRADKLGMSYDGYIRLCLTQCKTDVKG